jgi:hypothetical protein
VDNEHAGGNQAVESSTECSNSSRYESTHLRQGKLRQRAVRCQVRGAPGAEGADAAPGYVAQQAQRDAQLNGKLDDPGQRRSRGERQQEETCRDDDPGDAHNGRSHTGCSTGGGQWTGISIGRRKVGWVRGTVRGWGL